MKILIHSNNGDSLGLAQRFKEEGHSCWVFIREPHCRTMGDGLVDKVQTLYEGLSKKPDFVLFDLSGDGVVADRLRKSGVKVVGSSELADKMEDDRMFGLNLMKKHGIRIPETHDFKDINVAMMYVRSNPKATVIKMSGGGSACATSYVAKDAKDMLDYIGYQKERKLIKPGMEFVLQEKVDGIEISTEVWFSAGTPLLPYNGTFETKKFMPGDLGPATGCETSAVFPYLSSSPKIIEKTLRKVFPLMKEVKWTGPLDINCIVSDKDHEPYGLEWTPRIGYSAIYAMAAMMNDDLGEFFYGVASGTTQRIPIRHSWGAAVKASVPPYPVEKPDKPELEQALYKELEGLRIKAPKSPDYWFIDAKKDKKDRLVVAGVNGIVAECTGVGSDLRSAWSGARKSFEALEFPNKQGRILDGIDSAWKRSDQLRSWGYDVMPPFKEVSLKVRH